MMRLTKNEVRSVWDQDKKRDRRQFWLIFGAFILVFLLCLSFRAYAYAYPEKFVPGAHFKSYFTMLRMGIAKLVDPVTYAGKDAVIEGIGVYLYGSAVTRLKITVMSALAGAGTAAAGAVFQTIYKNPMASPGMLGATAGVRIGNILMITLFSAQALEMVTRRYIYCYAFTAVCVGAVLLLGRLSGDKKGNPSVMKMVMAGSVISQGLNVFVLYYMYNLTDENLLIYQQLTMGTNLVYDDLSVFIFLGVMAVSLIPVLLLRYRFNAAALDNTEAVAAGVNAGGLRIIGQVCAAVMAAGAMIHCGDTGMIGMMIPYWISGRVGANTKKVIVFSALAGAMLMMVSRLITTMFYIEEVEVPVSFFINIALTPAFLIMMAKNRRGFEE